MNTNIFKTSDLQVAVVLYAHNVPLLSLESTPESAKKIFVFQKTKDIDGLIAKFWGRNLLVEATMLFTAERELKRRLYVEIDRIGKETR